MKRLRITTVALILVALAPMASAQPGPAMGQQGSGMQMQPPAGGPMGNGGPMRGMPMQHPGGMMSGPMMRHGGMPMQSGQAAFGAIQEIVGILQADPKTDWTKVDIDALRQHLIDMNEVTMRAEAQKEPIDNGLRIAVTGNGRTLAAIQRMVPDHAKEIDGMHGWTVRTATLPNGVTLTVTATDPAEVQKIRALGFMGIMVQGMHAPHHLAMARGEPLHQH